MEHEMQSLKMIQMRFNKIPTNYVKLIIMDPLIPPINKQ